MTLGVSVGAFHKHEGLPPCGADVPLRRPTELVGGRKRRRGGCSAVEPKMTSEGFFPRSAIPRTGNAPRHAWQIAHVHLLSRPCRVSFVVPSCALQGHVRWGHALHRFDVARDTRRTNWLSPAHLRTEASISSGVTEDLSGSVQSQRVRHTELRWQVDRLMRGWRAPRAGHAVGRQRGGAHRPCPDRPGPGRSGRPHQRLPGKTIGTDC